MTANESSARMRNGGAVPRAEYKAGDACHPGFSLLPLEGGAPKGRRLALLAIARGLAPSYQSLLILDALIPIYYLQGGTHI